METEMFVVDLEELEALEHENMRRHHYRLKESPKRRRHGHRKLLEHLRVWRGQHPNI